MIGDQPVIDLATGQVVDPPSRAVADAVARALAQPRITAYEAVPGSAALRQAIADEYATRGIGVEAASVTIVPGARSGLLASLHLLARGGDVLVPAPYWSHLPPIVELAGATPRLVVGDRDAGWKIGIAELDRAARDGDPRALVLTTPVNPTGSRYGSSEVAAIRAWACERGIALVLDDTYWAYAVPDGLAGTVLEDRTVVVGGLSKVHALAGLRVGWVCAPESLAPAVARVVDHAVGPTSTLSQVAALATMTGTEPGIIRERARRIARLRDLATSAMHDVPRFEVLPPDGGIYMCVDAGSVIASPDVPADDDVALVELVARRTGVKTRAGSTFGLPDHLRVCVSGPADEFAEAAGRLRTFAADLAPQAGRATAARR